MNKTALKTFATEARKELLERIKTKAMQLGITEETIATADIASSDTIYINGEQLVAHEIIQRNKLINRIKEIGFDRVIDEVAYTWFNRFTALRFMEVNDYLPTRTRVLSSEGNPNGEPDMMKEALTLDLDLDKDLVYNFMVNNDTDELFKCLIKAHCNDLNRYMPFMFETIEDYTAILFPDGLLAPDSFLRRMTDTEVIPEDNWEKIEVIGWLYQYYIAEEKDEVFANLKKKVKISKEKVPAATQLFTPNWIVRYMVENSLGRIWIESNPESTLKYNWMYYLDEAEQEDGVINQLEKIRYKNVNIEEVTFIDPACGSGHILIYAFDLFYDMYLERGYIESDIPMLILEKNIFGLDIDNRAAQLASFAVMMKAREKSRRVFRQKIQPNISAIQESNWLTDEIIMNIGKTDKELIELLSALNETFIDAKEYGSLLKIRKLAYEKLENRLENYFNEESDLVELIDKKVVEDLLPNLINQSKILSEKYDVVCTNPPYMGRGGMNPKLTKYLDKNYKDTKSDLFATFVKKGFDLASEKGFNSMVTMQSWMFLSSYEEMRESIIQNKTITTLLHMENMVMGIAFGTAATIIRNTKIKEFKGNYTQIKYSNINVDNKPTKFPVLENQHGIVSSESFSKIPGNPIAYWVSDKVIEVFTNEQLGNIASPRRGLSTCANDKFYRAWTEINYQEIGFATNRSEVFRKKWVPLNKGGEFRKWYGNLWEVVDWEDNGRNLRAFPPALIKNEDFYFLPSITWSSITSGDFSVRCTNEGFIFDQASNGLFPGQEMFYYLAGILNSKVSKSVLNLINPSLNILVGDIAKMPIIFEQSIKEEIDNYVLNNIAISKKDWDSFELSWDFQRHPIMPSDNEKNISSTYKEWTGIKVKQFEELKETEEEINRIFIDLYGLNSELDPVVSHDEIKIRKSNLERDIKSFISYAIGCSFGRYSLDEDGLIYAGGEFDPKRYEIFKVDEDNILPILPGSYFEDDIVSRFVEFVRVTFGEESLAENLDFVADALTRRKNETARETLRRYFMNDFYKDHVQIYKKRPIYWQFTSGKEKAFNCLIYMHRYDKTTLSRIRTDYLHEYQVRLDVEKEDLMNGIDGDSTTKEINDAKKELKSLEKKIVELQKYDEVLHHMADMQIEIDLDDGVKVNYEKFKGLVTKI